MKCIALLVATLFAANASYAADNIPTEQAKKVGVKTCLPAIEKVAKFIIGDGSNGAHSQWAKDRADGSAFSFTVERNYSDGPILTNTIVVPAVNGKCYVEYQRIYTSNKSCLATVQTFDGASYKGEINKEVGILEHKGVTVYLLPDGPQNCIVIRKEIIQDGNSM